MKLVLLPGLDGTGELFGPFVAQAPDRWTTQIITYPHDQTLDYDDCTNRARRQLPVEESYLLLGESFSGPVAIRLAAEKPTKLVGLVLCNTFARRPWWKIFTALPWVAIFRRPIPSIVLRRLGALPPQSALRELMRLTIQSVPAEVLAHRLREVLRVDVSEALLAVEVPILYLRGSHDTTVRKWSLRYILEIRPDVLVSEISVAHLLLQLQPRSAWTRIGRFWEEWAISRLNRHPGIP